MHSGGKKTEISSFLTQKPSLRHPESSKIPAEDFERELNAAMEAEDNARVLEVLEAAPRWMREQSQFILLWASLLLASGKKQEALQLLLEIERKKPSYLALYAPLAMLYMDLEWPAHALQAAKRALPDRNLTDENRT
jgi:predicted Zn-dependent protease